MLKRIDCVLRTAGLEREIQKVQYLEAPIGEPVSLELTVKDDAGIPIDLTGKVIRFRLYDHYGLKLYETTKTVTIGGTQGVTTLTVSLPNMRPKAYAWDLWYESGGLHYQILPVSVWKATSTY